MKAEHEKLAVQKIAQSFLEGNGSRHCQQDKDLMIKYLIETAKMQEERIHRLEARLGRGGEVSDHDYPYNPIL